MSFVYYILIILAFIFFISGYWVLFIPLFIVFYLFKDIITSIKTKKFRCEHGIKTGGDFKKCEQCVNNVNDIKRKNDLLVESRKYRTEKISLMKKKQYHNLEYFYSVDPYEFENIVLAMYRRLGYTVHATTYSNDRGKDGIAYKDNSKYLIECKRYAKENKVGRPHLQKFFAAMHEEKAREGFFVTTGYFTQTAYEYANSNNIVLISGTKFISLMQEAYPEEYNNQVSLLCQYCGEINEYDTKISDKHIPCTCGKQIKTIEYNELFKKTKNKRSNY